MLQVDAFGTGVIRQLIWVTAVHAVGKHAGCGDVLVLLLGLSWWDVVGLSCSAQFETALLARCLQLLHHAGTTGDSSHLHLLIWI